MTDPLLTIEDATREFRVSPKTIRRRLTSGEIAGAYKRPGSRGPEWVIPRQSLAALGFTPRRAAPVTGIPGDVGERAAYWERRAADAEAALHTGGDPAPNRPTRGRTVLGWAFVGVGLVIALIAGIAVLADGESVEDVGSSPTGTMAVVASLLEERTDPGEAVGLVGDQRTDALPAERVGAPSPADGWQSADGPRYVVATFDAAAPPPAVDALRDTADMVMRAPHAGLVVELFDRGTAPRAVPGGTEVAAPSEAAEQDPPGVSGEATADAEEPTAGPVPAEPAPDVVDPGPVESAPTPVAPDASAPDTPTTPDVDEPGSGPVSPTASQVQVAAGDSFWTIAETVVGQGTDGPPSVESVTSYWSALVSANADQLVQPGNADLLHVGQTLTLPPLLS